MEDKKKIQEVIDAAVMWVEFSCEAFFRDEKADRHARVAAIGLKDYLESAFIREKEE